MTYPLTELPSDYFQGLSNIVAGSRIPLTDLFNILRMSVIAAGGYYVDPSIDGAYPTIADAFAAGQEEKEVGAEIEILVADGTYTDNVNFGTDHPIKIVGITKGAIISGSLTFGAKSALTRHLISEINLAGTLSLADGNRLYVKDCLFSTAFALVMDPSAGNKGYEAIFENCIGSISGITETASPTGSLRRVKFQGGSISFNSLVATPISIYKLNLHFVGIDSQMAEWTIYANPLINCNNGQCSIWFQNSSIYFYHLSTTPAALLSNSASASVLYSNTVLFSPGSTTKRFDFGIPGSTSGAPNIIAHLSPLNPPIGTVWEDLSLKEIVVFDGIYWCNGHHKRQDITVAISATPAADFDVTWDTPVGAYITNSRIKLLKAITIAGGAVGVGLGTGSGGDPDKYGKTIAAVINSKGGQLNPTYGDGGGVDLKLAAVDAAGAALGTIAGSNAADIMVVIYFDLYEALP